MKTHMARRHVRHEDAKTRKVRQELNLANSFETFPFCSSVRKDRDYVNLIFKQQISCNKRALQM